MSKVALTIAGKRYEVDVGDEFAAFLQAKMKSDFNIDGNNDIKLLINGYIKKNAELFELEKQILMLEEKLSASL